MKSGSMIKILSTGMAVCSVISFCGCRNKAAEESMQSEINYLEEKVADLNREIRDLKEENESLKEKLNNGSDNFGVLNLQSIEAMGEIATGSNFAVYDARFYSRIAEARWWDYDSTMESAGVYNTDTKTVAFSIRLKEDTSDQIYYAYYFSEDADFDEEDLNQPIFQSTIGTITYPDGKSFYNVDCTYGNHKGYYVVVIASDASLAEPYILAYACIK